MKGVSKGRCIPGISLGCLTAFLFCAAAYEASLRVSRRANDVILTWSLTNTAEVTVQQSTSLSAPHWTNIWTSEGPVTGDFEIPVPPTNSALFFRLLFNPVSPFDDPDDAYQDSNRDGIDGNILQAIFVSTLGHDSNAGTKAEPVRSLAAALFEAKRQNKPHIYVAAGTYGSTNIVLENGVSIFGGYDPVTWARGLSNVTSIEASTTAAVVATDLSETTVLDHLSISSADATNAAETCYGVFAVNSSGLVVRR